MTQTAVFTQEENLFLLLYLDETRAETMGNIAGMQKALSEGEDELAQLSSAVFRKLERMSDAQFDQLDPFGEIHE